MNISQLQENLDRLFHQEGHRLVFWYDPEQEFSDSISELEINEVKLLQLGKWGSFELKIKLERKDPETKYLLYAPFDEPDPDKDWLLDIKLYSYTFQADQASIILNELGLTHQSLKSHIKNRKKFFRSKERLERLKKRVDPEDDQEELDKKLLAVATKAEYPSIFSLTMKVLSEFADKGLTDQKNTLNSWETIQKCDLEQSFWQFMEKTFGYSHTNPTLQDLSFLTGYQQ